MCFCCLPSDISLSNGYLGCNSVASVDFESTARGLRYVSCIYLCTDCETIVCVCFIIFYNSYTRKAKKQMGKFRPFLFILLLFVIL